MSKGFWKGYLARAAFRAAFKEGLLDKPVWLKELIFPAEEGAGPDRIATAILASGKQVPIKVLRSERVVSCFRRDYPQPFMAVIVVDHLDTPENIRWKTYKELSQIR